jgi:acyl-CoA reductase-like NAD-dependent aldehyde dehydrogenase
MYVDPESFNGPLVDLIQFKKVLGYIEAGKEGGARLVTGGARHGEKVCLVVTIVTITIVTVF